MGGSVGEEREKDWGKLKNVGEKDLRLIAHLV